MSRDKHLTKKSWDHGNRFLNIEYYHEGRNRVGGEIGDIVVRSDDFRLNRVKRLEAPVGKDNSAVTIYRFDYHADIEKDKGTGIKKIGRGYTDVYDAKNHKTSYKYDEEHRLKKIIRYTGTDSTSYRPYTEECFVWDDQGLLKAKIFKDGSDHIYHARLFSYDPNGNVIQSTLCGKLTGRDSPPLIFKNGEFLENSYEREIKTYTYSNDGLNLLLSETDSAGKTTRYHYYPNTDLVKAKYISYGGETRIREFYFYDENNALEKKIVDDGKGEPVDDYFYVNERHITTFNPRKKAPVGIPGEEEEWFEDLFAHELVRLRSARNDHTKQGQLKNQMIFDADGKLAYQLEWDYDRHGNLIAETDAIGNRIKRKYDMATDNQEKEIHPDFEIHYEYDFADRLIKQKEVHGDVTLKTTQDFDVLGNCKSVTNCYNQTTYYEHDDFGRVIKITYPEIPLNGVLTAPKERKKYDSAGYLTSFIDANGNETRYERNIRGQPIKITYPDGTTEEMLYSLGGWLIQKTARNGLVTQYDRDPFGRVEKERVYGETVKETRYFYNSFHLIRTIDPENNITEYQYDFAGRVKEQTRNGSKTSFFYDSLGRLKETREYYGYGEKDYNATLKSYDCLDQLIEEQVQTADGEVFYFSRYEYDHRGNIVLVQTGESITKTEYNSRNEPITITDALGHQTHIFYDISFINKQGQQVLKKSTTDPLGYKTVEIFDTAGRLKESARFNPIGLKVARQIFSYDLVGNQVKREEEVIEEGEVKRSIVNLFEYNSMNQITKTIEGAGTAEAKTTTVLYNSHGQEGALFKPNGKNLHYIYDRFGRLKACLSSDGSIEVHYNYNQLDQITSVWDAKTNTITSREYQDDTLKKEILCNGLWIEYTYDRAGRVRTITLPDGTGIEYVYHGIYLKEIHRIVNGNRVYTHTNMSHSLSGQVKQMNLPGKSGGISYQFDSLDRCTSIESLSFRQYIPGDGFDSAGNLVKCSMQATPL